MSPPGAAAIKAGGTPAQARERRAEDLRQRAGARRRRRARRRRPSPQRDIGDALCTFESEVEPDQGRVRRRHSRSSIRSRASSPRTRWRVIDKVVDKKGTRKQAEGYLEVPCTDEAQEIAAKHQIRPRSRRCSPATRRTSRRSQHFTIDEVFGGWAKAQKEHFDDGGDLRPDPRAQARSSGLEAPRRACFSRALLRRHSVLPGSTSRSASRCSTSASSCWCRCRRRS